MISQLTGRYGLAGGALGDPRAVRRRRCGPQVSRLVDRHGQRRVLRPADRWWRSRRWRACCSARSCGAPDWTLFVFAAAAGLHAEPRLDGAGPLGGALPAARPLLHTAYSCESVVDELCFIVGPIVSIGLCTAWFPEAGPLLAAVLPGGRGAAG